jgi:hypothetical protein
MKDINEFVQELNDKFPKIQSYQEVFVYTTGKRFYKICKSRDGGSPRSAYAFVDKNNGDLYKAASWAAPANYVRGNINDPSGLDACEEFGVKYLR